MWFMKWNLNFPALIHWLKKVKKCYNFCIIGLVFVQHHRLLWISSNRIEVYGLVCEKSNYILWTTIFTVLKLRRLYLVGQEDIIDKDMIQICGYFCELKFTLHFHRIKTLVMPRKEIFQVICTLGTEMFAPLADFST